MALRPLPLATGAWLLTLPHAPLFLHRDPLSRLGARFGLILLEMQKEKPQPRALRGAEAGGLIGSILGEFLWRAGHPLPEPQGARPAFLLPSHACLLPLCLGVDPARMRTVWAGRDAHSPRMVLDADSHPGGFGTQVLWMGTCYPSKTPPAPGEPQGNLFLRGNGGRGLVPWGGN